MFTAVYLCRSLGAIGLRTRGLRQTELLHSLTVKLTETFPALRQAAEEKKRERLGWLPDAAYRWRATCWYSRSIAHTVSKIITCDIIRRSHSIVMTDTDGLTGVWDVVKMRGCLRIIFLSFSKVLPIMCAHRSRAHLAPDSFSNDAHSRGRLATSTTTRSFPIPALVSHLGNG